MHTIRPWLSIGAYRDTLDLPLLTSRQIGAMLQLAEHVAQPTIASLYLPVEDGVPLASELLQQGVVFMQDAHQRSQRILVACGAGISRSTTFAAAALIAIEGLSLLEAITIIKQAHPEAMPHPVLWASLCAYYDEAVPYVTLFRLTPSG